MFHNPITKLLRKAFLDSVKENKEANEQFRQSRRKFLRDSTYTAGGFALVPPLLQSSLFGNDLQNSKIVIVGAGIAGLNTCYQLKKMGIHSTVYESSQRVGGRMFTMKDEFGKGITTDIGGEFVDTTHTEIIELMKEFNLSFYDLREDKLEPKELYFRGKHITNEELKNAFTPFVTRLTTDIKSLPEKISYKTADSFKHLDNLSIAEYISGIGISGWLYDFINVVLTREYGMEITEQSAINFLIMFEPPKDNYYEMFGDDHEVMKIKGGSQHLSDAIYEKIKDKVVLKHQLVAISKKPSGYDLLFKTGDDTKTIHADYIVLGIPFSVLRTLELNIDMPGEKRKCIDEMGYGNSCKFIMGMGSKPWRSAGKQGYTFSDISFGCGWDSSQSQSLTEGSFTVFAGGKIGDSIYEKSKEELVSDFVEGLDTIYQGAKKSYTGKNIKYCWEKNAHIRAGYSSFKKGQWSTLAGWEAEPVGNIYFAGEHVSRDFQGYMNGGAQTGRVAAENIAGKIKKEAAKKPEAK
ncbi:MAG: FAD-dependent oxidoreductase [Bacteroidetes bacterium]|nr:FAD-dependent oxidoreductase [Bacteroidota bacterium]